MKKILIFTSSFFTVCSFAFAGNTPSSWYQLPEDKVTHESDVNFVETESSSTLEENIDAIFQADQVALNRGIKGYSVSETPNFVSKPKDWVPWRAEIFMTDLSLSAGGLLGVLTTKGTATVRAYWRKQYPRQQEYVNPDDLLEAKGAIHFSQYSTPTDIKRQIAEAINIGVQAKKIIDTPLLRTELFKAAEDFQALAFTLDSTPSDKPWWVQRFRVDFTVDGSGHVNPAVVVGGEVRFRFEWHRIKKASSAKSKIQPQPSAVNKILNQTELQKFVKNMSEDIEEAFPYAPDMDFQAHTMRMGIGISAKGTIGVVKGSAGVVGQIYFTRDVKRPTKNLPQPKFADSNEPVIIIERNPPANHILFAEARGSHFELNETTDHIKEAVYKVNRKNFRKGLKKAAKISKFFIDRAAKQKGPGWKIFELRTGFDASISGELDMAVIQGAVTAQVNFFNQKF